MSSKVEDIMIRNVKTADSEESVTRAAEIMNHNEIGSILVVENGAPVGVVTERDILKRVVSKRKDPASTRLSEIMSKPLVAVKPRTTITFAVRTMIKQKIKKLPVLNNGKLVGILSLTDLIPLLKDGEATSRLRLNGAPKRMKRVLEACIDPETQQRKKCPLIIMGGMPIGCLGRKCMWYDIDGCCFQTFVQSFSDKLHNHRG